MMLQKEPAVLVGAAVAVVDALVALAAYLLSWDGETTALVLGAVTAVASLAGAFLTRSRVSPV